jgi:DNA helicase II / ATP-dependent DNA helicase PcrA
MNNTSTDFASNTRSLFVVGDDAQSIYGFRGSKIEIILGFEKTYPSTTEIILNQNYRSTQPILDLAEQILTHNPRQKKKDLFTDNQSKKQVHYHVARNEREEAEFVLSKINELYVENQTQTNISLDKTSAESEQKIDPQKELIKNEFSVDKLRILGN